MTQLSLRRSVRRILAALFIGVAVGATACTGRPASAPPVLTTGPAVKSEETLTHAGRERRYLVHDFSGGQKAPVVIVMHGGGGNAENAVDMTQFDVVGAREKLIIVYPEGTARRAGVRLLTWNAGNCCAAALEDNIDDVGFLSAMIDRLVQSGRADPARIYATGMSNGGMMSHRAGRELSDKLAGIAPVVGALFGGEPPPRAPVPAFIIVGAEDRVVPNAGGPLQLRAVLGDRPAADKPTLPAVAQADYWAAANGCGASRTTRTAASEMTSWTGCRSGADVVYHVVANNGHSWPGGRPGREGDRAARARMFQPLPSTPVRKCGPSSAGRGATRSSVDVHPPLGGEGPRGGVLSRRRAG